MESFFNFPYFLRKEEKMAKRNLFKQLCKYKPTSGKSPLENFCTEAFVYLLEHLWCKEKNVAKELLELFNLENINNFSIETQTAFNVQCNAKSCRLIPDIHIEADGKHTFIEVKVESPIGLSKLGKRDQLDDYNEIKIDGQSCLVFSLTKYDISSQSIGCANKIRWEQIHSALKSSSDELAQQFKEFLEDNYMNGYDRLEFDITKAKSEKENFNDILKQGFDISVFSQKGYSLQENAYMYADGNGWYVNKGNDVYFWIGSLLGCKDYVSKIVFEVLPQRKIEFKKICDNKPQDTWKNTIAETKCLKDILDLESREKQIADIRDWLNGILEKLNEEKSVMTSEFAK